MRADPPDILRLQSTSKFRYATCSLHMERHHESSTIRQNVTIRAPWSGIVFIFISKWHGTNHEHGSQYEQWYSISVAIQNPYVMQVLHRYKYYGVSRFWHFQPVSTKMFRVILSAILLTAVVRAGKRGLDWTYCLSTIFSSRVTNILFLWTHLIDNGGLYDCLFDFHTCSRIAYIFSATRVASKTLTAKSVIPSILPF